MNITNKERDTILAALRYWQRSALNSPTQLRCFAEWEIATNGGEETPLDKNEIDELCETINVDHEATSRP